MVVKDCIERGLTYFDLGRGEERYKSSWCDTKIQMIETNLALTRYASGFTAYERVKTSIKRVVRNDATLWNIAKWMRSRLYGRM